MHQWLSHRSFFPFKTAGEGRKLEGASKEPRGAVHAGCRICCALVVRAAGSQSACTTKISQGHLCTEEMTHCPLFSKSVTRAHCRETDPSPGISGLALTCHQTYGKTLQGHVRKSPLTGELKPVRWKKARYRCCRS